MAFKKLRTAKCRRIHHLSNEINYDILSNSRYIDAFGYTNIDMQVDMFNSDVIRRFVHCSDESFKDIDDLREDVLHSNGSHRDD